MKKISAVLLCLCMGVLFTGIARGEDKALSIRKGSKVALRYVLTVDGKVVDSSNQGPLRYVHGEGQIIPGLEKQLEGMHAGETKTVIVPPEEAYGPAKPEALQEIDRSRLPKDLAVKAGTPLQVRSKDGRSRVVKIAQVKEKTVVVDFNHPLAGKTLTFNVQIETVE